MVTDKTYLNNVKECNEQSYKIGFDEGKDYAWKVAKRLMMMPCFYFEKYFSDLKREGAYFTFSIFDDFTPEELEKRLDEIDAQELKKLEERKASHSK